MKVTNWRRKLAANLVACGLMSPAAGLAANLDTNLVANGTFESVDLLITGDYGAPKVLQWSGTGFAYSHQPGVTGIPDYADGADPPGAGNWYFTSNNQPSAGTGDVRDPDVIFQDIDVSTGATGTQIASGEAAVRLSAFFSSYLDDNDFGNVHVQFKNAGGTTLGTAQVSDLDPGPNNVWSLSSGASVVPVGTATLRVSLFGTVVNGGTDGYIDNVDVQLTNAANELVFLEVNTTSGQARIKNQTGDPVQIDYYEIKSAAGSLRRNTWTSLQDQNLAGFPAGDGSGNGWEEAGGGGNNALGESFLTGSSTVTNGASISLGPAFGIGGAQDLDFSYAVVPPQPLDADFDGDGDADGADFLRWQLGNGTATGATKAQGDADGDGAIDGDDLAIWRGEFGDSPFGGPGKVVRGFVRYVTSGATAAPEPGSVVIAGMGLGVLALGRRRNVAGHGANG
jgi:hypothetical protein